MAKQFVENQTESNLENQQIYELAESGEWKNKPSSNEDIYKRMEAIEKYLISTGFTQQKAQQRAVEMQQSGLLGNSPDVQTAKTRRAVTPSTPQRQMNAMVPKLSADVSEDSQWSKYLPWIIGGAVAFFVLTRRK